MLAVLEREGHRLHLAESGKQGQSILRERPVQLVITDHQMPDMSGLELLKVIRERHPEVRRTTRGTFSPTSVYGFTGIAQVTFRERGDLAHVRVSNAVCITLRDLVTFVKAERRQREDPVRPED